MDQPFQALVVRKPDDGPPTRSIETLRVDDLPAGDVLVRVEFSSLNYKDALAATGHAGVVRQFPHVPGIDAAGVVVESNDSRFESEAPVVVTGYELGSGHWGGWSQYVRVPADWVVPLPGGLTPREAMIWGTAGFTAAQSVLAIEERDVDPGRGPVVVTGASGGVGSLAVGLLARAGYEVVAVTGKPEAGSLLERLGAARVAGRDEVDDTSERPLLAARWSAAVDTVGGPILATILRSTMHRGVVTCCGLVAGHDLNMTVYPFILRGASLVGIDSAHCPMDRRLAVWQRLAGPWKIDDLEGLATTIGLGQLDEYVEKILAGRITGRTVVDLGGS